MRRLLLLCALPALAGLAVPGAGGEVVQVGGAGGARFVPDQRTRVAAAAGAAAELRCAVHHLGDKVVSWVRSRDLQILSHAGVVFTGDARVTAAASRPPSDPSDYSEASDESAGASDGSPAADVTVHTLRIAGLRAGDAGRYECQVNTEPKMSLMFDLVVVDEEAPHIHVAALGAGAGAGAAVAVPTGAAAALACEARWRPPPRRVPPPPLRLRWLRGDQEMAGVGGVSIVVDRGAGRAVSRLTLAAAAPADAGAYRCEASARGHTPRSVTVYLRVLDDGGGGGGGGSEMLGDEAAALAHAHGGAVTSSTPAVTLALLLLAALLALHARRNL